MGRSLVDIKSGVKLFVVNIRECFSKPSFELHVDEDRPAFVTYAWLMTLARRELGLPVGLPMGSNSSAGSKRLTWYETTS